MGHVTESIYSKDGWVVPMAEVSHVEPWFRKVMVNKPGYGEKAVWELQKVGSRIVFKHSQWNNEADCYQPEVLLDTESQGDFISAWCHYRHELEFETLKPLHPEAPCSTSKQ